MRNYGVNDTFPDLVLELVEDEEAVNLTGVLAVALVVKRPVSGTTFTKTLSVDLPATSGLARCVWLAGDLSEAGDYLCDVKITRTGPTFQHSEDALVIAVRAEGTRAVA